MKVVSLVPSVTETLVRWGTPPVACTRFCEQPGIATIGGTKNPDVPAIVGLAPDLVVLCVEENRREDADALAAAGVATAALSIDGVEDVAPALDMLASLVGADPDTHHHHRAGLGPLVEQARRSAPELADLRAFIPIWKRPWMTLSGGTYGSSLLAALGVVNVFADADDRYPQTTLEEAAARRPDVVLAPSEPYPFGPRHLPLFADVAPVVLVDGQDLFWWGVRTPEALQRLARSLSTVAPRSW